MAQAPPTAARVSITGGAGITVNPSPLVGTGTVTCTTFSSTLVGCVPASGGGTANFLRADGAWVPPGGGGVTWPASNSLVVSNSTSSPAGLAPVNGDLAFGVGGLWVASTPSLMLDTAFGATQGGILYRGAASWTFLAPGGSGNILTSGGTGQNPSWVPPTAAGGVVSNCTNVYAVALYAATQPSQTVSCPSALGAAGTVLTSTGTATAPTFQPPATGSAPPLREITGAVTANTATAPADCNGTIVWNSATTNTAKVQTLPVVATAACANGASITIVDGAGDAASGGQILVTAGAGSTLGSVAAGTNMLLIGAKNGSVKLSYDTNPTTPNWVVTASSNPGSVVPFTASQTVTPGQWFSGTVFSTGTNGLNVTLPAVGGATATAPVVANGGITVQTILAATTLLPQGSDTIAGPGSSSSSMVIPANSTAVVTLSGSVFQVTLAPANLQSISWSAGMNLGACTTLPCYIPITRIGSARNITGIVCGIESAAASTATIDVVASTGQLSTATTPLTSAPCHAETLGYAALSPNTGTPYTLAAGTTVGLKINSWSGTTCPNCSGMVAISLQ
jgi:hypothetical protein